MCLAFVRLRTPSSGVLYNYVDCTHGECLRGLFLRYSSQRHGLWTYAIYLRARMHTLLVLCTGSAEMRVHMVSRSIGYAFNVQVQRVGYRLRGLT